MKLTIDLKDDPETMAELERAAKDGGPVNLSLPPMFLRDFTRTTDKSVLPYVSGEEFFTLVIGNRGLSITPSSIGIDKPPPPPMTLERALREMRTAGWAVAVHNDYTLNGKDMTFWGFSNGSRWVKGEGETDLEAVGRAMIAAGSFNVADPQDVINF